jgi:hypothetical protein
LSSEEGEEWKEHGKGEEERSSNDHLGSMPDFQECSWCHSRRRGEDEGKWNGKFVAVVAVVAVAP